MGSAIGAGVSLWQYKKQKKEMKNAEARQEEEKRRAEALTPALAQEVDDGGVLKDIAKKRKGVQATMTAKRDVNTLG